MSEREGSENEGVRERETGSENEGVRDRWGVKVGSKNERRE